MKVSKRIQIKMIRNKAILVVLVALVLVSPSATHASEETDVRGTVERVFQQLKARDYGELYDSLPASSRTRMSRDRFTNALKRAQDMYVLERLDIGPVRVSRDLAVVDTVLYGRVVSPIETEGKIVVQQYLVREDGRWRVATGDTGTVKRFLASNPAFARKFPIRQPRIYVKQNNRWVEFTPPRSPRR
jgi:hypothetical protein